MTPRDDAAPRPHDEPRGPGDRGRPSGGGPSAGIGGGEIAAVALSATLVLVGVLHFARALRLVDPPRTAARIPGAARRPASSTVRATSAAVAAAAALVVLVVPERSAAWLPALLVAFLAGAVCATTLPAHEELRYRTWRRRWGGG